MTTVQRKRRHFRDDMKRQILADIESGKIHINNVTDPVSGKPIKALLIERWKDQFRTEGVGANFQESAPAKAPTMVVRQDRRAPSSAMSTDELLKEIGRLTVENNQLKRVNQNAQSSEISYAAKSNHA